MSFEETLSYDDVLLLPSFSDHLPGESDVKTELAPGIRLTIPVVSAAMDTVTEASLAIALALEGGIGVIHRNMDAAEQGEQVAKVKRYLNWIIESPVTVEKNFTVAEVAEIMKSQGISGLPVLDKGRLCGIITSRDMRFCSDYSLHVSEYHDTRSSRGAGNT